MKQYQLKQFIERARKNKQAINQSSNQKKNNINEEEDVNISIYVQKPKKNNQQENKNSTGKKDKQNIHQDNINCCNGSSNAKTNAITANDNDTNQYNAAVQSDEEDGFFDCILCDLKIKRQKMWTHMKKHKIIRKNKPARALDHNKQCDKFWGWSYSNGSSAYANKQKYRKRGKKVIKVNGKSKIKRQQIYNNNQKYNCNDYIKIQAQCNPNTQHCHTPQQKHVKTEPKLQYSIQNNLIQLKYENKSYQQAQQKHKIQQKHEQEQAKTRSAYNKQLLDVKNKQIKQAIIHDLTLQQQKQSQLQQFHKIKQEYVCKNQTKTTKSQQLISRSKKETQKQAITYQQLYIKKQKQQPELQSQSDSEDSLVINPQVNIRQKLRSKNKVSSIQTWHMQNMNTCTKPETSNINQQINNQQNKQKSTKNLKTSKSISKIRYKQRQKINKGKQNKTRTNKFNKMNKIQGKKVNNQSKLKFIPKSKIIKKIISKKYRNKLVQNKNYVNKIDKKNNSKNKNQKQKLKQRYNKNKSNTLIKNKSSQNSLKTITNPTNSNGYSHNKGNQKHSNTYMQMNKLNARQSNTINQQQVFQNNTSVKHINTILNTESVSPKTRQINQLITNKNMNQHEQNHANIPFRQHHQLSSQYISQLQHKLNRNREYTQTLQRQLVELRQSCRKQQQQIHMLKSISGTTTKVNEDKTDENNTFKHKQYKSVGYNDRIGNLINQNITKIQKLQQNMDNIINITSQKTCKGQGKKDKNNYNIEEYKMAQLIDFQINIEVNQHKQTNK